MLRVIADGKGAMPGMGEIMSTKDVQAVVTFVRLLSPAFEQYNCLCAACHGPDGHPPAWPLEDTEDDAALEEVPTVVFHQAYFRTRPEAHVRGWRRHMLTKVAPSCRTSPVSLSKDKIRHIIAYLRSLP
jgi:mono/diheme cytochrome c family protein